MAWITTEDVAIFLGFDLDELSELQLAYLEQSTAGAISFAQERRAAAGYTDNPNTVPSPRVKHGVVLLAGSEFREQGSIDSFQSYQADPSTTPVGNWGKVMRYLGINRPAIG